MKAYKTYLVFLFVLPLLINNNCKHDEERPSFIIKNESDKEIVIQFSLYGPISHDPCCMKPNSSFEYSELLHTKVVFPNSETNFYWIGEMMTQHTSDTLYVGAFYLDDIVSLSCEEFEQLFPLKKEWNLTFSQLENLDWTLNYKP